VEEHEGPVNGEKKKLIIRKKKTSKKTEEKKIKRTCDQWRRKKAA